MKISDLITELNTAMSEHGDIKVVRWGKEDLEEVHTSCVIHFSAQTDELALELM